MRLADGASSPRMIDLPYKIVNLHNVIRFGITSDFTNK
jgi:hypothetical protein